jgi:hypothetical protein
MEGYAWGCFLQRYTTGQIMFISGKTMILFFVYRISLNHLYLSIHKTKCKEFFNSYSFEHFYFILQTWVYKIGGKHN